jgi:hypothetical protein
MTDCALKWGQLAPFPKEAHDFTIETEGNMFTRTFIGSFSAPPTGIRNWLLMSPGIKACKMETLPDSSTSYVLQMADGASYGKVIVSMDQTHVSFKVEWS